MRHRATWSDTNRQNVHFPISPITIGKFDSSQNKHEVNMQQGHAAIKLLPNAERAIAYALVSETDWPNMTSVRLPTEKDWRLETD